MLPVNQPLDELARPLGGCRVGLRPPRNDIGFFFDWRCAPRNDVAFFDLTMPSRPITLVFLRSVVIKQTRLDPSPNLLNNLRCTEGTEPRAFLE